MTLEEQKQALLRWCQGDQHAAEFLWQWLCLCHTWDDLVDRDADVPEQMINEAFVLALLELPCNPFFERHRVHLVPLMRMTVLDWMAANELERANERHGLSIAWTLRCNVVSLIGYAAALIGGYHWGAQVQREARLMGQQQSLFEYLQEHMMEGPPDA